MSEPGQSYRAGRPQPVWDADRVHSLRHHLGLTQRELADELGVRQQTISEWETGSYRPRGAARRLLGLVAERAGFAYGSTGGGERPAQPDEAAGTHPPAEQHSQTDSP